LGAIVISKADYGLLLPSAIEGSADFRKFSEDHDPSRVLHYAHLR
jgi:hypothetical protein